MENDDRFKYALPRRRFLQGAAGMAALLASPVILAAKENAAAPAKSVSQIELINIAVRERMLIERTSKLYAQTLVAARTSDAKRLITDSVSRFDALYSVHKGSASASSSFQENSTLESRDRAWAKYRSLLERAPTEKNLSELVSAGESLSRLINQTTGASAQFLSGSTIGQLVDRSGKQCYLSQRIAKSYFYRALKFNVEEANRQIADARKDFMENAAFLAKAHENTMEIKFLLQLATTQWPYFDDAISQQGKHSSSQSDYNVATTAENMLEVLERTNQLYFKLSN